MLGQGSGGKILCLYNCHGSIKSMEQCQYTPVESVVLESLVSDVQIPIQSSCVQYSL